jgi:monothiol glutaredoxin
LAIGTLTQWVAVDVREVMTRNILDEAHIHPAIRETIANSHADIIREVQAAIAANDVVVVGMKQNPHPRRARRALDAAGIPYKYLEYGSYLDGWRRRNALKMWTGWPTFPMVFVKGVLIGGADDLARLIDGGELRKMMTAAKSSSA